MKLDWHLPRRETVRSLQFPMKCCPRTAGKEVQQEKDHHLFLNMTYRPHVKAREAFSSYNSKRRKSGFNVSCQLHCIFYKVLIGSLKISTLTQQKNKNFSAHQTFIQQPQLRAKDNPNTFNANINLFEDSFYLVQTQIPPPPHLVFTNAFF